VDVPLVESLMIDGTVDETSPNFRFFMSLLSQYDLSQEWYLFPFAILG
jgi:hypothetical protein